jgi:hypothetical protein
VVFTRRGGVRAVPARDATPEEKRRCRKRGKRAVKLKKVHSPGEEAPRPLPHPLLTRTRASLFPGAEGVVLRLPFGPPSWAEGGVPSFGPRRTPTESSASAPLRRSRYMRYRHSALVPYLQRLGRRLRLGRRVLRLARLGHKPPPTPCAKGAPPVCEGWGCRGVNSPGVCGRG